MQYISYNDLSNDIRNNLYKIPSDIDLIVGIPRSGMMVASIIGLLLNKSVMSLDNFAMGNDPTGGFRYGLKKPLNEMKKVLVIDDTVFFGNSMIKTKNQLKEVEEKNQFEILYGCVYTEGPDAKNYVDLYFVDNHKNPDNFEYTFYEWNILHSGEGHTSKFLFDLDGILCVEPPDENRVQEYEEYIKNAIPLFRPSSKLGGIVTYRFNKYREVTEEWLRNNNIDYNFMLMIDENHENARKVDPAYYKASVYKDCDWVELFVESEIDQAERIFGFSKKPVFCYKNGKLYQ